MADEEKKYPEEVPVYESDKPEEDIRDEMKTGEKEADVYTEEGREELKTDEEMSPREQAFMEGAEGMGEDANCKQCGKVLSEAEDEVVAREINGKRELFCSNKCADIYQRRHESGS